MKHDSLSFIVNLSTPSVVMLALDQVDFVLDKNMLLTDLYLDFLYSLRFIGLDNQTSCMYVAVKYYTYVNTVIASSSCIICPLL